MLALASTKGTILVVHLGTAKLMIHYVLTVELTPPELATLKEIAQVSLGDTSSSIDAVSLHRGKNKASLQLEFVLINSKHLSLQVRESSCTTATLHMIFSAEEEAQSMTQVCSLLCLKLDHVILKPIKALKTSAV